MKQLQEFLQPKEISITGQDGLERKFVISIFTATDGREIVTQYPITAAPKIGDYKTNEALMFKVLGYAAVVTESATLVLSTRALIDNHTGDYETLMRLEYALMEYNCSFLRAGKLSNYLELVGTKFQGLIMEMLTRYSQQSKVMDKPH